MILRERDAIVPDGKMLWSDADEVLEHAGLSHEPEQRHQPDLGDERADDGVSCSGQTRRRKDDSLHGALFVVISGLAVGAEIV